MWNLYKVVRQAEEKVPVFPVFPLRSVPFGKLFKLIVSQVPVLHTLLLRKQQRGPCLVAEDTAVTDTKGVSFPSNLV